MENLRLQKVLQEMKVNSIPHMIITDPASIYYLTNKWISPGERLLALYLTESGNHKLLINELFPLTEEIGIEKIWYKDTDYPVKILAKFIDTALINTIGIDKNWPSRFLLQLMELKSDYNFVNGSFIIDTIRMIKDTKEIELMKEASSLNDCAIEKVIGLIAGDSSEKEICNKLIDIYDSLGTDGPSFDPIIAFGANCSDPHHEPDGSSPKPGDSVIVDIGCKKSFYCSDMTRTVFYKSVSEEGRRVYNIVKEANARAIATVKPGVRFCDIDIAARSYIEEMGYGKYFTHRTGHSIGLEVHDEGDVSSTNTNVVLPGMIFSIEPGIYLPGGFGVRIEDLVVVTDDGCLVLNNYTKELTIID